jgi:hypothetical protein
MASSIASQVEQYLLSPPGLKRDDLQNDPGLRKIIFQRVSFSGEASLYVRFNPETQEPLGTFVMNRNKGLEGQPFNSLMVKGVLDKDKDKYDEFGKMIQVGPNGEHRVAPDFYLWKNEDGILKERILVGELGAEVGIKSKDEIGDLADATSRMQDSIRLSIERLRRRGT